VPRPERRAVQCHVQPRPGHGPVLLGRRDPRKGRDMGGQQAGTGISHWMMRHGNRSADIAPVLRSRTARLHDHPRAPRYVGPGTGSYGSRREHPKVMRYEQKGAGERSPALSILFIFIQREK